MTVDGLDQMEQVGHFLWLPWVKGTAISWQRSENGPLAYWEGTHDGYQRLPHPVQIRRGMVQLGHDHWLSLDRLESDWNHTCRLQWLLPDLPYNWDANAGQLSLELAQGRYYVTLSASLQAIHTLARADERSPRGWQSPYYYQREPALSLDCTVQAKSILFWTLFGPDPCRVTVMEDSVLVESTCWKSQLNLFSTGSHALVRSIAWDGVGKDRLEVVR